MLEIQERFDTAGYEHIIAAAGINNVHITEALDGSTAIGFIAYAYEAERTVVYDYDDGGDDDGGDYDDGGDDGGDYDDE